MIHPGTAISSYYGMKNKYVVHSPGGWVELRGGPRGIAGVKLLQHAPAAPQAKAQALRPFAELLARYFEGTPINRRAVMATSSAASDGPGLEAKAGRIFSQIFEVLESSNCTAFHLDVYRRLASVPFGSVISYGELARRAGRPGAGRAVGGAMGANDFPLFIPCHRVVRADGRPGGFAAGRQWKVFLLRNEGHRMEGGRLKS